MVHALCSGIMNPGTHTYTTNPTTYYNASLAMPTHQQVEIVRETAKAVQLRYESDSEHGQGEVTSWFPRSCVKLAEHKTFGLVCEWCAAWLGNKLASGDHRAVLVVG